MRQSLLASSHYTDAMGNPSGGRSTSLGLHIRWHDGPIIKNGSKQEPNGCLVENLIEAAIDRIEYFQGTVFQCRENALAITKLQEGLHWLKHNAEWREASSVEGTHIP